MNSIEHAACHSGIGILRTIFHKLPAPKHSHTYPLSKAVSFNYFNVKHFHKTICWNYLISENKESNALNDLNIKKSKFARIHEGPDLKKFMPSTDPQLLKEDSVPYLKPIHGHNKKGKSIQITINRSIIFL